MIPKFRAWWIQDEVMTHIDTLEFLQGGIRVSDGCWHEKFLGDEVILMQSTGLIDRNGVEIFEGDIVKIIGDVLDDDMSVIRFTEGGFYLDYKNLDTEFELLYSIDLPIEIIGNIYENPELLEVEV